MLPLLPARDSQVHQVQAAVVLLQGASGVAHQSNPVTPARILPPLPDSCPVWPA